MHSLQPEPFVYYSYPGVSYLHSTLGFIVVILQSLKFTIDFLSNCVVEANNIFVIFLVWRTMPRAHHPRNHEFKFDGLNLVARTTRGTPPRKINDARTKLDITLTAADNVLTVGGLGRDSLVSCRLKM